MAVRQLCRLVGSLCLAAQILAAAHARADLSDLVMMIDDSRATFRPVTADDVSSAKATVRNQLNELTRIIGYGQDWRDYLMWDAQFQEFNRSEVGTVDLWNQIHARVARDTDLFEQVAFQQYRSALRSLIRRINAHDNADLEDDYQAVLTELTELLSRDDDRLPADAAARVSELLTRLDRQHQAPELIEAIRHHAMHPNLIIEVPATLFASDRHFKEDYTFRQVVRGSPVEGSGTLEADQSFSLGADDNSIIVTSVVEGSSNSTSIGFGNGVTVRSSGALKFESASNIRIDVAGVQSSGFDTTGSLSTAILGLSVNYTGRAAAVARQTVYGRQEADRQAAQYQALSDLDTNFNSRLDSLIAPMQAAYRRNLYLPLARHDRLPQKSHFASSEDRATVQLWFADEVQLAAPSEPPWSESAGEQVRLAVHESAVNNTSALLEGRIRSLASVLSGTFFEYIAESAKPSERIDIRFDEEVTIRGTLRDGILELRLVGNAYIIEGSTYPGMEITLRYQLETDDSTVLRLLGSPQVEPHVAEGEERSQFGLRGIALRRILTNVLKESAFDTFDLAEIMLPAPFDGLGKFQTQRIVIDDGWFIIEAIPMMETVASGNSDGNEAAGAEENES